MQRIVSLTMFLIIFFLQCFADTEELVRSGSYDENGKCLSPAVYIVHPHEFTHYDYRDRPDLAGQGMPKKKKKSAWKTFIEDNPKKYCDEEDVKREKRECEAWHKNKNERVEWCERLLKENWGEDALNWYKVAIDFRHHVRMLVQVVGIMGGPEGAVGATASELAWAIVDYNDAAANNDCVGTNNIAAETFSNVALDFAQDQIELQTANRVAEAGRLGTGGGLDAVIHNYGLAKNTGNAKSLAIYNEATAAKAQAGAVGNLAKAMPFVAMGQINIEYGLNLEKLKDLEKQHGEGYRRCVEAINELKNCRCPVCGSL